MTNTEGQQETEPMTPSTITEHDSPENTAGPSSKPSVHYEH